MPVDDETIRRRIDRALNAKVWNVTDLVRAAKERGHTLDPATVRKMLSGERRPQRKTVVTIALALGVAPESLLEADDDAAPATVLALPSTSRVEEAVRSLIRDFPDDAAQQFVNRVADDPTLVDEAVAHILTQYGLLRRVGPVSQPADTDRPPLRSVAEHGNPADRAELRRLAREARESYEAQMKGSGDQGDDHR